MVVESESERFTLDGTVDLRGRPVIASRTGRWKACTFIIGYEAFERMAFFGIASNLVNYLTTQLGEGTVSSVRNVNNWPGAVWITPIAGAYIADAYLGRFWTFTVSSLIYVMGMILLTVSVSLKSIRPTCENGVCSKATVSQIAFFYSAICVIAVGAGGTKPNISTFGSDQFDDFDPVEKKMKSSFFNWWVFGAFMGNLVATVGLVYIQENLGWGLGYGIPTIGLVLSLIFFYLGTPLYRHKARKAESPIRDMLCVPFAAFKKRHLRLPGDPSELHEADPSSFTMNGNRQLYHTPVFRFLDKAAIKESACASSSTRRLPKCTVTQVERVKLIWGMLPIWLTTFLPSTIWAQSNTLFVKQGTTLDRTPGGGFLIPAASLSSVVTLSMLVSIAIYDLCFVPFMRRKTGNPRGITLLQRLGIGFILQIVSISVDSAIEAKRMDVISGHQITGPKAIVPMSILRLVPQYILLGIADVFNAIGVLEFFYDQSPDDLQSLGTTLFTTGIAVENFMNSLLVTVVDSVTARFTGKSWIGNNLNNSHLDYFYAFLALVSTLNLGAFVWASTNYVYKRESVEGAARPDSNKMTSLSRGMPLNDVMTESSARQTTSVRCNCFI